MALTYDRELPVDPEYLFDLLADATNSPQWESMNLGCEKITPGPIGLRTAFRCEFKGFGAIRAEIVGYERPVRLQIKGEMASMVIEHSYELAPVGAGTRLTETITPHPKGVFRVMTPVIRLMMGRALRADGVRLLGVVSRPASSASSA